MSGTLPHVITQASLSPIQHLQQHHQQQPHHQQHVPMHVTLAGLPMLAQQAISHQTATAVHKVLPPGVGSTVVVSHAVGMANDTASTHSSLQTHTSLMAATAPGGVPVSVNQLIAQVGSVYVFFCNLMILPPTVSPISPILYLFVVYFPGWAASTSAVIIHRVLQYRRWDNSSVISRSACEKQS